MSKEEQIGLIAGRIIDEYRKHPLLEWNKIAASKIHSQWFEHYTDEIAKLKASKSEANEDNILLNTFGQYCTLNGVKLTDSNKVGQAVIDFLKTRNK